MFVFKRSILHWKSAHRLALAVALSIIAFNSQSSAIAKQAASDRVVVIISIDGLGSVYLNDPKAEIPTLRQLAAEGAVADRMKSILPTLTWPNHTTLITGVSPRKHGVIGNDYWDRETQKSFKLIMDPIFNKEEIIKAPTLYDVAHENGLKTAAICWPASRGAKTLDWTVPDVHDDKIVANYSTPELLKEFRAAGIPYEKQQTWCDTNKGRERDQMYTQMLIHILKQHRPNLALLHLVEVDHAQHGAGPRSPEAYAAIKFEDDRVKEILDVLKKDFAGRATVFIVSDHGFAFVRQKIQPNVKLRQAGLLNVEKGKITSRRVFAFSQGGSSFVYILDNANRAKLINEVAGMFKDEEGIDQVVLPSDYKQNGFASPDEDPHVPDLILTAKNGFSFSEGADGDAVVTPPSANTTGAHGHSPSLPDLYASFIAWGEGIKAGAKLGAIENRDLAPTAASLLGLRINGVEGKVLKKALK